MTTNRQYMCCSLMLLTAMGLLAFLPVSRQIPFWILILLLLFFRLPWMHTPGRLELRTVTNEYAFVGALVYLTLLYLAAVALGQLARSPYDLSPVGILTNMLLILPALCAREQIRGYCLGTFHRTLRHPVLAAVVLTLLFTLTELNYAKTGQIHDMKTAFLYVTNEVVPALSHNTLRTVLVYYGGAFAGILYYGTIQIFFRIFPFLPDLNWLAQSAVSVCVPVLTATMLHERCMIQIGSLPKEKPGSNIGFVTGLVSAILFSWFCSGVFPVYPTSVLTGSMEPGIMPGDAVLIRKLMDADELKDMTVGTVISFKRDDIMITHRIMEVHLDEAGNYSFVTKGDNNDSADVQPVEATDVRGTVIGTIPKAGLPAMVIKGRMPVPKGVVDGAANMVVDKD